MENCTKITTKALDAREITETTKKDIVGSLPVEIAQELLLYLPPQDIAHACFCSKKWRDKFRGYYIWKKKCEEYGYTPFKSKVFEQFTESKSFGYWEGVYKSNEILEHNWKNNIFKETLLHTEGSMMISYLDDDWLIIIANASKLLVVEYSTMKIKHCLHIYPEDHVREIKKCNDLLFCLSIGSVLKVWNLQTGLILTEMSFFDPIEEFEVDNNRFAYLKENSLNIFNIDTGTIEYQCNGQEVYQMFFYNDSLVYMTSSDDIHILNLNDKSVTILPSCTSNSSERVKVNKNYLLTCTVFGRVCIWNIATKSAIHHNLYIAPRVTWKTKLDFLDENKFMYVDDHNQELHVWDVKTGVCTLKICNVRNVFKILCNTRYIIVSDYNKTIRIYCPNTGSLIGFVKFPSDLFNSYLDIMVTETKLLIQNAVFFDTKHTCACILDYSKINNKKLK